jgi:serine protease Do
VRELDVREDDNRELPALVIGVDPATDLALLKVDAKSLPTIPWGDSSKLKVAEWVLAIGNPYQLSQTVTLGIISALNRTNLGVSSYEDFVQTDAAINPGNSGGALVNARGELVGINTVIFSQSGGYQGIGFAVSSNLARRIFADLQQYGEVRRGSIGLISFAPLTPQLAARLDSGGTRTGVVVWDLDERSAAYRAGLEPGDIIVAVNGTAIADAGQLTRLISDTKIGGTVAVDIVRRGRRTSISIPVGRVVANR